MGKKYFFKYSWYIFEKLRILFITHEECSVMGLFLYFTNFINICINFCKLWNVYINKHFLIYNNFYSAKNFGKQFFERKSINWISNFIVLKQTSEKYIMQYVFYIFSLGSHKI